AGIHFARILLHLGAGAVALVVVVLAVEPLLGFFFVQLPVPERADDLAGAATEPLAASFAADAFAKALGFVVQAWALLTHRLGWLNRVSLLFHVLLASLSSVFGAAIVSASSVISMPFLTPSRKLWPWISLSTNAAWVASERRNRFAPCCRRTSS